MSWCVLNPVVLDPEKKKRLVVPWTCLVKINISQVMMSRMAA